MRTADLKGTRFWKMKSYIIEIYISVIWYTSILKSIWFEMKSYIKWTLYKYDIWKWFWKVLYDTYFRSKDMESAFCLISALWPHCGFILSILFSLFDLGFPDMILECPSNSMAISMVLRARLHSVIHRGCESLLVRMFPGGSRHNHCVSVIYWVAW